MKFAASIDSFFHKQFLWSLQCCLIAFQPQENFFENGGQSSQTLLLLYQLSFCNILNPLLPFQPSSQGGDSISRNHFPCTSINSSSSPVKSFILRWQHVSPIFSLQFWFFFSCCFHHICSPSSTEVLNPSKSSMRVRIHFFQTPVTVDVLTSSH